MNRVGIKDTMVGLVIGLVVGCCFTALFSASYLYKLGQIDCINGAVYYKLEKQLDGSTEWENNVGIVK